MIHTSEIPATVHVTPYDNLWNKISAELARPKLHPSQPPADMEKIRMWREELKKLPNPCGISLSFKKK